MNATPSATKARRIQPLLGSGYSPDSEDLKGLFQYTFNTAGGLSIECFLEFEAGEKATSDCPGYPDSVDLVWALVAGVDISEVLGDTKDTIEEEEALEDLCKAARESKEDAAIEAYESRRDDERMGY